MEGIKPRTPFLDYPAAFLGVRGISSRHNSAPLPGIGRAVPGCNKAILGGCEMGNLVKCQVVVRSALVLEFLIFLVTPAEFNRAIVETECTAVAEPGPFPTARERKLLGTV